MWSQFLLRKIHQDKSAYDQNKYAGQIDPLIWLLSQIHLTPFTIYIGSKMVYVFAHPILFTHQETGFVTTVSNNPAFANLSSIISHILKSRTWNYEYHYSNWLELQINWDAPAQIHSFKLDLCGL